MIELPLVLLSPADVCTPGSCQDSLSPVPGPDTEDHMAGKEERERERWRHSHRKGECQVWLPQTLYNTHAILRYHNSAAVTYSTWTCTQCPRSPCSATYTAYITWVYSPVYTLYMYLGQVLEVEDLSQRSGQLHLCHSLVRLKLLSLDIPAQHVDCRCLIGAG